MAGGGAGRIKEIRGEVSGHDDLASGLQSNLVYFFFCPRLS